MTESEIRNAFTAAGLDERSAGCIRIRSRSGKEYWLHADQLSVLEGDKALLIVYPVRPHPRKRGSRWVWMAPRNMAPT